MRLPIYLCFLVAGGASATVVPEHLLTPARVTATRSAPLPPSRRASPVAPAGGSQVIRIEAGEPPALAAPPEPRAVDDGTAADPQAEE